MKDLSPYETRILIQIGVSRSQGPEDNAYIQRKLPPILTGCAARVARLLLATKDEEKALALLLLTDAEIDFVQRNLKTISEMVEDKKAEAEELKAHRRLRPVCA